MLDFSVAAESDCEKITGYIYGNIPKGASYYFYVIRYGRIVHRSGWQVSPSLEHIIDTSGTYTIQGHVKHAGFNIYKVSSPVFVILEQDQKNFVNFLNSPVATDVPPLKFFASPTPFLDFLVSFGGSEEQGFDSVFSLLPRSDLLIGDKRLIIYSPCPLMAIEDKTEVLFSGIAKPDDGKLVVGQEDIFSVEGLRNAVGTFTLITYDHEKNRLDISSDYFGVCKIFYFQDAHMAIVSNRLHLLLHAIAKKNIQLEIDYDELFSTLTFGNLQPFHQSFSSGTLFHGVNMLPVDRKIVISMPNGFELTGSVIESDLSDCLRSNDEHCFSNDKYEEMLAVAASEIVKNANSALECSKFNNVIVDLSGGLDSRLVFSAVTNIHGYREKIFISTRESKSEPKDHVVACAIQSFYSKYKFDDLQVTVIENDLSSPWSDHWSYYLGTYYSYVPSCSKQTYSGDTIRLVGFYGEICARHYYSRRHRGTELDVQLSEDFVEQYFMKFSHLSVTASPLGFAAAKRLFLRELNRIPGRTAMDKFELHYLYFRNGLHCSPVLRTAYSTLEWGPLQSKTLFKIKHMFPKKGTTLQLDAIRHLNPLVARVPYQADTDENERTIYFNNHSVSTDPIYMADVDVRIDKSIEEWESSVKRRSDHSVRYLSSGFKDFARQADDQLVDTVLAALQLLLNRFEPLRIEVGTQLWLFITLYRSDVSMRSQLVNYGNRIMSIYYQCQLLDKINMIKNLPDNNGDKVQ